MRARVALVAMAAVAALATTPLAAVAATPQTSLSEISSEVMCPVCGTLLELAESPQAQREKVFVQRLVDAGKTKAEIKDALVAEYCDRAVLIDAGAAEVRALTAARASLREARGRVKAAPRPR